MPHLRFILAVFGFLSCLALAGWLAHEQPWVMPTRRSVEALIKEKRFDEAARLAERLTQRSPRDPAAWFALARARAGCGQLRAAVAALRNIPAWSSRKQDARLFEAKLLLELKRGREAEAALLECIAHAARPDSPSLSARLELFALYAMQERDEAFKALFWTTYPLLSPADQLAALTMRMRLEFEQTEPELNAALLRQFVQNDPADYQARAGLAAALDHAGDLKAARALYEEALEQAPDDAGIRARLLDLLMRQGEQAALEAALAATPTHGRDHAELQKFFGLAALARQDIPAALAAFQRAVELRPELPENNHRLAQILFRDGQTELAARASAERNRLNEARERLRKAWNAFADAYEANPDAVPPALVRAVGEAASGARMIPEAGAFVEQANRLE